MITTALVPCGINQKSSFVPDNIKQFSLFVADPLNFLLVCKLWQACILDAYQDAYRGGS